MPHATPWSDRICHSIRWSLDGEASHQLGLLLLEVVVGHAAVVETLVKGADGLEQSGRGRLAGLALDDGFDRDLAALESTFFTLGRFG